MLKKLNVRPPWKDAPPIISTRTFNFILKQIAMSDWPNAGEQAEEILQFMLEECVKRPKIRPDVITLNSVLQAYSKQGTKRNAKAAEKLFDQWQKTYFQEQRLVRQNVDRISYNTVLSAHVRAKNVQAAIEVFNSLQKRHEEEVQKAKKKNSKMQQTQQKDKDNAYLYKPDVVSFATMLRGYAQEGRVEDAQALFDRMQTESPHNLPAPTLECYNELLYAYSNSNRPEQAQKFLKSWIDKKEPLYNTTAAVPRPDSRSYNVVLYSIAKKNPDAASFARALRLLDSMPVRDAVSYTTLINIACRLRSGMVGGGGGNYRNGPLESAKRALQRAWSDPDINIDAAFISNVLYSLASCREDQDTPVFCETLVADMNARQIPATMSVYNALIYAWSKSGDRKAAKRVVQILTELENHPNLHPDIKTYTNVLDCLAKSRWDHYDNKNDYSLNQAVEIWNRLQQKGPAPTVQTYTAMAQNYARSKLPFKAVKAAELLKQIKQEAADNSNTNAAVVRPTIVLYNAILNAAEHTDASDRYAVEEALKVACLTFDEVRSSPTRASSSSSALQVPIRANHVTYGTFLGALSSLMPAATRREIVELVFKRCCLEGQCSRLVLKKLQRAVENPTQYRVLLEQHAEDQLPTSWTCNVHEARARELPTR
jgi:pentatricopeptide repeat protein